MNYKKQFLRICSMLGFLVLFGIGTYVHAATWYSQGAVTLNNITNWNSAPDGSGSNLSAWVNTDVYVVQSTHVLTFAAATFDTLRINSTGAHVTAAVTVNGTVVVTASCSPTAAGTVTINGNLIVRNGAAFTPLGSFVANNVTISDATMQIAGTQTLDINGNLTLSGTSALTPAAATAILLFSGGTNQTITVSDDSYLEAGIFQTATANTNVTTTSNLTVIDEFQIAASTTFNATDGTVTFNPSAASNLWTNNGTLSFYDVIMNLGFAATPSTNAVIKGNLTKIGASTFGATAGTITFTNTSLSAKQIQIAGGAFTFFDLAVSAGSKVSTSSSFTVAGTGGNAINIGSSAEFKANAGTITISGAAAGILNSGTLEFNNLTLAATAAATTTSSSFKILGNFTVANGADFLASAGTITFENTSLKTISNVADDETVLGFNNLVIAANSKVTTAEDFTLTGNFTLASGSEFTATSGSEAHFEGTTSISVASDANLEFYDVIVGATANGTITTTSNFKVTGLVFTVTDAADLFNATGGTVTFTAACVLTGTTTDGRLIFNNITIQAASVSVNAGDYVQIRGNLTINGTGGEYDGGTAGSTTTFVGTSNSTVSGTTDQDPAALFDVLVLNKTGADGSNIVYLQVNTEIVSSGTSTITLTDGYLNLGSTLFTVGANTAPTNTVGTSGIDGATGTYFVSTGHVATFLTDDLFTVAGVPTLYNLRVLIAHTMGAGNLTVNNNLEFTGAVAFTIPASQTLEIKGNVLTTAAGTFTAGNATTSILKLTGTGTCQTLANALFSGTFPSITLERGETLTGNLALVGGNVLTINNSTNFLDLNGNTLDISAAATIQILRYSGGIDAEDVGSTVVLNTNASVTTIPANLFKNNTVRNLTLANSQDYTLGGDLTITGTLAWGTPADIITNNNTLTFGPNATLPTFTSTAHIIGNLKRTVTNTATVFDIGDGTANGYAPVALLFANSGSSQVVKVSVQKSNPTIGRGGDPTRAVNAIWSIVPEGTAPVDTLRIEFGWGSDYDNGLTVGANTSFGAKWSSTQWTDYRDGYNAVASPNFAAASELIGSTFPINAANLSGDWAVFIAAAATNTAKDTAISVTKPKLAIKNITPSIIGVGLPFTATIELQDQYGNPLNNTGSAMILGFSDVFGTATFPAATIPVGSSSTTVSGFSYAAAGAGKQFKVTRTSGGISQALLDGVSPIINVVNNLPSNQVNNIVLTSGTTSTTLDFSLTSDNAIIIAKAGSAITSDDFPIDGQTYYASSIFGQGSTIGDAVVVYKGADPTTPVTITGLAPQTTYYFRGFSYGTATPGTEKYLTFAAANNPKSFTTGGTNDDDATFGSNNTFATAKPIGTNTPVKGTIKTATDVDWFSFSINNSSPNLRARLTLSASLGNYNVEVYDINGRVVRRGLRISNNTENQIVNELTSGTYLVKISGVDGAFDATNPYTLLLTTTGNEIFSVTP